MEELQSQDYQSSSRTQTQAHQEPRHGMQSDIDTVNEWLSEKFLDSCLAFVPKCGAKGDVQSNVFLNKVRGEGRLFLSRPTYFTVSLVNALLRGFFLFF